MASFRKYQLVIDSWNAYEVFLLIACILAGVGGILDPHSGPSSIQFTVPIIERYVWYVGLVLGGSIALFGAISRKIFSLYIERVGLVLITGVSIPYGIILTLNVAAPYSPPVLSTDAFAVASLVRLVQIWSRLRGDSHET